MTTPNKGNLRLWVAALRSGEFAQGKCQNYYPAEETAPEKFCCLGVACLVAEREGVAAEGEEWRSGAYLTWAVRDWLGVESIDPVIGVSDSGPLEATVANDFMGLTFAQIADHIEKEFNLQEGSTIDGRELEGSA